MFIIKILKIRRDSFPCAIKGFGKMSRVKSKNPQLGD